MNVCFLSFGCKVNLTETEYMRNIFAENNFTATDDESQADIFIINSCTVTDTADSKLKKTCRRLRREYPSAIIIVTGCFVEAHPQAPVDADILWGTSDRQSLPGVVSDFLSQGRQSANFSEIPQSAKVGQTASSINPQKNGVKWNPIKLYAEHEYRQDNENVFEDFSVSAFHDNTRAFLKIQDGCNMNCAYCIIPRSRGKFRSKPIESVKRDALTLQNNGYKELVLTGINLAFYGIEFGLRLIDAIEAAAGAAPKMRIRLGSLEPELISEDDIKRMKNIPQLCPQFHLSLQSFCDATLRRMSRRYTVSEYIALVERLRAYFPDFALTTDVMVGFPGETDAEFAETLRNIRETRFADIHIFPFSPREKTVAYDLPGQIPEHIKHERAKMVAEVAAESRAAYHAAMVGRVFGVLFEREKSDGIPEGFAENYVRVMLEGIRVTPPESYRNRLLKVKITAAKADYVLGKPV